MQGRITKFREDMGIGIIEAETGQKFRFAQSAILNAPGQMVGQEVDFLLGASRPTAIIVMAGSPWTVFGRLQTA